MYRYIDVLIGSRATIHMYVTCYIYTDILRCIERE
jgi:hypothetical protein